MTEVISNGVFLSDSTFRSRPHFSTYLYSDANAGGNDVQQIMAKRALRQTKFPTLVGRREVDSFVEIPKFEHPSFKKFNDVDHNVEGIHRAPAPVRSFDNIVDPVSNFVSPGGEVDRTTGIQRLKSMSQFENTPQVSVPQFINSVRLNHKAAPPETRRLTQSDPGTPYAWDSRKRSDDSIKSEMGGWTSERDTRENAQGKVEGSMSQWMNYTSFQPDKNARDKLALKYMFTTSTERGYADVPHDTMYPPRKWAAPKTLEDRPDMIDQRWTLKRYDPKAEEWQAVGRSWDYCQNRKGYWYRGPTSIAFCSPTLRNHHIPGYGGSIGADNLDEMDNRSVPFEPYTIKRVNLPRSTETAHRPNIPKYDGCTLYDYIRTAAHSLQTPPEPQTTARVHRNFHIPPNSSEHKRESHMSKMVTTVPPHNPFNKIEKGEIRPQQSPKREMSPVKQAD